eukprot:COSAG01_NODE_13751_length_1541_cov_1.127601_1_plen_29_part_10
MRRVTPYCTQLMLAAQLAARAAILCSSVI